MTDRVIVVGGGLVGLALANGLADAGREVVVLDEGDVAYRASRGNAGLVWVQGKGVGSPDYAAWTRRSAELWPEFARRLQQDTDCDVAYRRTGGFHLCLSEAEFEASREVLRRTDNQPGGSHQAAMVGRSFVRERLPDIGERVVGASWCPHDGHVDPLKLLFALHRRARSRGVCHRAGQTVHAVRIQKHGFGVDTQCGVVDGSSIVLAAGLANARLGGMLGFKVPVRPVRGQILVTERLPRFLAYPTTTIRQTAEGTVLLGNSHENAGFDVRTTLDVARQHGRRALLEFPRLAPAQIVRSWAALRVMSPDGLPIYAQSARHPGAFVATCHSGVTLAATHALRLAPEIAHGALPPECAGFNPTRFDAAVIGAA